MTLPELCERSEKSENIMPNTLTTNTLKNATPLPAASDIIATADNGTVMGADDNNDNLKLDLNHTTATQPTNNNSVGEALKAVLQQAASQGRVSCSLGASVDLLSSHPDDVMLCVMPLLPPHPDAAAAIQSTLIRAVCLEHNIRVLSVDCDVKLAKTVLFSAVSSSEEEEEEKERRAAVARRISLMIMEDEDGGSDDDDEDEEEEWDDNCNTVLKTPSRCSEDVGASSSSPSSSPSPTSSSSSSPFFFSSCDNLAPVMGFPCVLVRYPTESVSKEDELVAEFCKEQFVGYAQQVAYIELPD